MSSEFKPRLTPKQQYWLEHIQRAKADRHAFTDYAREHSLDLKALYNYHWLLRKKGLLDTVVPAVNFIQVSRQINEVSIPQCSIDFPNGVRVAVTVNDDTLLSVLKQVAAL